MLMNTYREDMIFKNVQCYTLKDRLCVSKYRKESNSLPLDDRKLPKLPGKE